MHRRGWMCRGYSSLVWRCTAPFGPSRRCDSGRTANAATRAPLVRTQLALNPARNLCPGVDAELIEDVRHVRLHGPLGEKAPRGDLLIAHAVCDKAGDLKFPLAQRRHLLRIDMSVEPGWFLLVECEGDRFIRRHPLARLGLQLQRRDSK